MKTGTPLLFLVMHNPEIKIDEDDLLKFGMAVAFITEKGYIRVSLKGKYEYLHRAILEFPSEQVDHINRCKLDVRKENLRLVTAKENSDNQDLHRDNLAGKQGVVYVRDRDKYAAHVCVRGKRIFLGYYSTKEEAHARYLKGKELYNQLEI